MDMSIGDGLVMAVLGVAIVFFGLIILMIVIKVEAAIIGSGAKKKAAPVAAAPAPAPAAPAAPVPAPAPAPVQAAPAAAPQPPVVQDYSSSTGEVELNGVHARTAAMLMAIVADELQAPMSELEFVSVKCIGEEK